MVVVSFAGGMGWCCAGGSTEQEEAGEQANGQTNGLHDDTLALAIGLASSAEIPFSAGYQDSVERAVNGFCKGGFTVLRGKPRRSGRGWIAREA